jgi:hypothetical protein
MTLTEQRESLRTRSQNLDKLEAEIVLLSENVAKARAAYNDAHAQAALDGVKSPKPPTTLEADEKRLETLQASFAIASKRINKEAAATKAAAINHYQDLRGRIYSRVVEKQVAANAEIVKGFQLLADIIGETQALNCISSDTAAGAQLKDQLVRSYPDILKPANGAVWLPELMDHQLQELRSATNAPDVLQKIDDLYSQTHETEEVLAATVASKTESEPIALGA